jgi:hypothetical protein
MAELIPPEYRMRMAQRAHVVKWVFAGVAALAAAGGAIAYGAAWERGKAAEHAGLAAQFREKSVLITRSQELRGKRQELANRMSKIQELRDDKVLLSLLRNIAGSFSADDCLETVKIEAHGAKPDSAPNGAPAASDDAYAVHLSGITTNSTTLAALMTRLTQQNNPAINVVLENSHRDKMLDGQVMRFQILCEKPQPKGT